MTTDPYCARATRHAMTAASQAMLLAAMLSAGSAAAAKPAAPKKNVAQAPLVNFGELAQHRPRKCAPALPAIAAPAGWKEIAPLCVWQGLLQMRRWQAKVEVPGACVSPAAQWWAWQRARAGLNPAAPGAAWHSGWKSQFVAGQAGELQRIAIIERRDGANWTATEWTWSPSPRAATRVWQQGRFDKLTQAASKAMPGETGQPHALRMAWEKNLNGRAGEVAPDGWRWASEGRCLRMLPMAASDSPLPLPYAREDARLEQRAAMQIQLARRYPQATFLVPFRMLDVPANLRHSGAKYIAVWTEKTKVTGQLWIPQKGDAAMVRAKVGADLPARYDTPSGLAASVGVVRAIEHELSAIATTWSVDNER